jgi:hypothetical protein
VHGKAFGVLDAVVAAEEVQRAYELSLRELNRVRRMCTPPLYRAVAHALVESLDVSTHGGLRLALWVRLATRLMTRTYEGISLLHADLVLDPANLACGQWQVGAFTKTTDGVYGRVTGWDHERGCIFAMLTIAQLLRIDPAQLRMAAFGSTSASTCSCERGCLVCLTVCARLEGVDEPQGLTPVFQSLDADGRFDGGSASQRSDSDRAHSMARAWHREPAQAALAWSWDAHVVRALRAHGCRHPVAQAGCHGMVMRRSSHALFACAWPRLHPCAPVHVWQWPTQTS